MVAGDTHGDTSHFQKLFKWAKRFDVDTIVQVGDFGFVYPTSEKRRWSNGRQVPVGADHDSDRRLHTLNRLASEAGITVYWLDGNHEDFSRMRELGATPSSPEPVQLASNVTYLPRAYVWEWGGVCFMSMGGAFSIDKDRRTPGLSWWPEETITSGDVFRAEEAGQVDVLLAHDTVEPPPETLGKMMGYQPESGMMTRSRVRAGYKLDRASRANRQMLTEVVKAVDPALMIHGHFHYAYQSDWVNPETKTNMHVVGLEMNGGGVNSYVIFDTEKFDRNNPNQWS